MKFKKLIEVSSVVMCLGLVACNNSSETKEEISLDEAKKYAKDVSEFEKYNYSSIKVTSTIKEVNITGNMASLFGNSLKSYVGVSQSETFSYKDNYSNYVFSLDTLKAFDSSTIGNYNILSYKIYKTGNKISIETSLELVQNTGYEGTSFSFKVSSTSLTNYNEDGFITSLTMDSSFTYNDNSSLTQKSEGTVEWIK